MLTVHPYVAPAGATTAPAAQPLPAIHSGQVLTQEEGPEGTYVRTDLTSLYDRTPWPMLPEGTPGRVTGFYRAFVDDRVSGVFVVYDRLRVQPSEATPYRFRADPNQGLRPAAPFVQGYFAPISPGALGLEVRTLTVPIAPDPGAPNLFAAVSASASTAADLLDAPFLTVLRYTDAAAVELRTLAARSRSGDAMIGARVQTGGAPRFLFFNAAPGAQPAPVVTTELPSEPGATWALFGLKPGASYAVSVEGVSLVVTERAGAPHTASAAGVLQVGAAPQSTQVHAFTYTLAENGPARVVLCDMRGREVAVLTEGVHTAGKHLLPLSGVAPGAYVVQVMSQAGIRTQPVTIPQG